MQSAANKIITICSYTNSLSTCIIQKACVIPLAAVHLPGFQFIFLHCVFLEAKHPTKYLTVIFCCVEAPVVRTTQALNASLALLLPSRGSHF